MNLQRLNPWNWFKHEENRPDFTIPVKRSEAATSTLPTSASAHNHWPMQRLHQEIDRLFDQAFRGFGFPSLHSGWLSDSLFSRSGFHANINVASDDNHYYLSLEAPGLTDNDVTLELNQNLLVIRGEKKEKTEANDRHYYRVEHSYGSFQRVLNLPDDCDENAITATMKNGLLEVTIPRKPGANNTPTKRIPINH